MQHTNHPTNGDTGKYFFFDEDDFTEMVGDDGWDGSTFEIIQTGSQNWAGTVKVWKETTANGGAHGRRDSGADSDQWTADDTIILQSCEGTPSKTI